MVKATAEKVSADMSPPNYRGAIKLLGTIQPKKDKIGSLNGEIGGIFDRVEGFKVNKKAAKVFMALDKLEAVERNDIMRSLEGLIAAAEWDRSDLLSNTENDDDADPDGDGESDDDEVEEITEPLGDEKPETDDVDQAAADVEKPEAAAPSTGKTLLERSRRHLRAVPPPAPEPYTGDNSDLNPPDVAAG